ncbi:MAG TPA: phosphatase PAP2 family protein [Flavisolibacter sp.]
MAFLNSMIRRLLVVLLFVSFSFGVFAQNADINILRTINHDRPVGLDPFFRTITNSTYPISVAIPAAMVGAGFLQKDSTLKNHGFQVIAALGLAAVVTEGLKVIVQRPRPFTSYPSIQKAGEGDGSSFPSGHVSIAFTTATSLSLLNHRWYVVVPSFAWASTIAYARMDLGVHYPSDVLAGAIIGSASAFVTYKANKWLHKRRSYR